MDKRKLVTLTLFLSTLAVLPLSANIQRSVDYGIVVSLSEHDEQYAFSERIASFLENKGLETEAAERLSKKLTGEKSRIFDHKVQTLLSHCPELDETALVAYLSEAALHQSSVKLEEYGDLVSMMTSILHKAPEKAMLRTLHYVAKINRTIYG